MLKSFRFWKDFFYIFDFQILFMKKIYTLVLFIITFFIGNAQIVNIPDANFKAKLLEANYGNYIALDLNNSPMIIDTNGNGEIEQSEVNLISQLNIDFANISNLVGISSFPTLRRLNCSYNNLTTLDVSQNVLLEYLLCNDNLITTLDVAQNQNLLSLQCSSNQLTILDITQNLELKWLNCSYNQITSLDVSQNSLIFLYCDQNQITSLDVSQNNILRKLGCSYNQLTYLNTTQNPLLEYLSCSDNQLSTLDFSQNLQLEVLNCSDIPLTLIDLSQHVFLKSLYCSNNQLSTLDLSQNSKLNRLVCNDNQLSSLFIKNNNQENWDNLSFNNNPNLQYICADEGDIATVQQNIITYGYTNCHVNSYCSFVPNGTFYTIQGNSKFDSNANGCDASDSNMPNQKFTFTSGALSGSLIPDESGDYTYAVQSGTHVITPVLENPNYFIVSPTSASVTFPTTTSPFTQDFCITANGIKNDLEITIIPIEVARPGFDAHYKIVYKNKGNQIANGTLSFSFDDSIMDLISSIPSVDGSGTNSFNWNFTNLNPFETREIDLIFNINSPIETPAVNGDDVLVYTATIVGATDETPNDNTFTLNQTVVNSYDPNDKTCLEGNTISPNMVGEYVHYVIRFENTGTFAAENVVIADVIDTTKFEINTLIPQSSSHDFFTRINGDKVEFIFENINLPFDDENNDGYVAFKIKTKSNLVVGDQFTNTASIYFDYNFPIITNTTSTTVEEPLSNQDFDFETNFTLYPNPAKDVLNFKVKSEMEVKSISIYNTLGQIIMTTIHAENGEINVSNLQSGNYFIKVFTDKGSSTAKFIKQ